MSEISRWHPTVSDTPNDQVGSNNGTYEGSMGTATTGEPTVGGSRHYLHDGTDDAINIPDDASMDFSGAVSCFAWAYSDDWTQSGMILSKYGAAGAREFYLAVINDEIWGLVSSNGTAVQYRQSNAAVLTDSTWHHIGMVFDGSGTSLLVYVDGTDESGTLNGTVPSSFSNSTADMYIGKRDWGASELFFDGRIDKVRYYDEALSAGTISTNYAEQRAAVGGGSGIVPLLEGGMLRGGLQTMSGGL